MTYRLGLTFGFALPSSIFFPFFLRGNVQAMLEYPLSIPCLGYSVNFFYVETL